MLQRMKMLGPQPVARVQPREPAADDPHDSIADEPSEQVAYAVEQIAAMLGAIQHNLEALTQAVLALAAQQDAQREETARPLAAPRHAERPRPPVALGRKRRERVRATPPPQPAAEMEIRSPPVVPAE